MEADDPGERHGRPLLLRILGIALLVVAVAVGVVLAIIPRSVEDELAAGEIESIGDASFYVPPSPLTSAAPGTVVRTERLNSAPEGSIGWRVLYHSTDAFGRDILTSGVVVTPDTPAPAGGRVVVGWAHPTTGAVARCAPSNGMTPFLSIEAIGPLLNAGYAIAAADYPGLGVEGPSSYLIGASEGHSVLDSVRAARSLPEVGSGSTTVFWGHSQGGQAALFAGQLAAEYAPEMDVKAVAVAAPAADLGALLKADIDDISGVTIGSYAFSGFQSAYGARYPGMSLDQILTPEGVAATAPMSQLCLLGQNAELHNYARPLIGKYLRADPETVEPWATLLQENTPAATPADLPLFVAQGGKDTLVVPSATEKFVGTQCAAGRPVDFKLYPDDDHGTVALTASGDVASYFQQILAGEAPTSTC
ncbi:lipase family protein [Nakamurella alba]|uniref:lipase family protein n=1 Tax=Nakamurella alba TaxID=2665158 RepID=UPI002AC35652|nr:lipase family protein [Nakamurella alba]